MLEVLRPVTFILASVRVIERAFSVSEALLPVSNVPVSQQLVLTVGIEPDVSSETALVVVFPVAGVLFIACEPVHNTVTVTLVVLPSTFIVVA